MKDHPTAWARWIHRRPGNVRTLAAIETENPAPKYRRSVRHFKLIVLRLPYSLEWVTANETEA